MITFLYTLCIWCNISEKHMLNLFIFGTVIRYHVLLMHVKCNLAICQNLSTLTIFFFNVMFVVIS